MKEIKITKYEANDGTQFNSEEECKRHEKFTEKDYDELIKTVPHCFTCHVDIFPSGGCDDYVLYFNCKDKEQAHIIASWCELHNMEMEISEEQMAGRTVVIPDIYGSHYLDGIDFEYAYGGLTLLDTWVGRIARWIGYIKDDEWETE